MIFGDIDLQAHRNWLEPVCGRASLEAVIPLWNRRRRDVAHEIIDRGIRADVVCVDTSRINASFCGLPYDVHFLAHLPATVCPCGGDGEFHTFVWDAPGFARPLLISPGPLIRVPSRPPLAPTELAFAVPSLSKPRFAGQTNAAP